MSPEACFYALCFIVAGGLFAWVAIKLIKDND